MNRHKRRRIVLLCVGLICLALAIWTVWGNQALMVSEVSVSSARLPASFPGYRIAHVSDLHNAEFGEDNARLLQLLSDCAPDLIAITGDLIDANRTDVEVAVRFARKAVQIAPVYYVPGNHEARCSEYGALKSGLEEAGVTVLEDEAVSLERNGETIALLGLTDPAFSNRGDSAGEVPAMTVAKLNGLMEQGTAYSVLLAHRPELFETYAACDVDLVLSGHAHGGQFRLPLVGGLIAPNQGLFPKYDAGLFAEGNTNMIVSRGIGNSIIPIRFNNRPEVVLIELCAAS